MPSPEFLVVAASLALLLLVIVLTVVAQLSLDARWSGERLANILKRLLSRQDTAGRPERKVQRRRKRRRNKRKREDDRVQTREDEAVADTALGNLHSKVGVMRHTRMHHGWHISKLVDVCVICPQRLVYIPASALVQMDSAFKLYEEHLHEQRERGRQVLCAQLQNFRAQTLQFPCSG